MATVDEFELSEGAATPPPPRRSGAWHRRPFVWAGAACALIVVGAIAAEPQPGLLVDRSEGADYRVIDVDLTREPNLAWQTPSGYTWVTDVIAGVAVAHIDSGGPSGALAGIDVETGETVWTLGDASACQYTTDRVTCVENAGVQEATVVTIDPADGDRTVVEHAYALAALTVPAGTVVIEETATDSEDVVLVGPDGAVVWRTETDAADNTTEPPYVDAWVQDGVLVLGQSSTAVDLATGRTQDATPFPMDFDGIDMSYEDGHYSVLLPGGEVELLETEVIFSEVDDDIGGPVALLSDDYQTSFEAVARDGAVPLWSHDAGDGVCWPAGRLQGLLLLTCEDLGQVAELRAIDQLTGELRWVVRDVVSVAGGSKDTVIALTRDGSVLGVDLREGTTLWQLDVLAAPWAQVTELEDGLLLSGDVGLMRLDFD